MSVIENMPAEERAQLGLDRLAAVRAELVDTRTRLNERKEKLSELRTDRDAMENIALAGLLRPDETTDALAALRMDRVDGVARELEKAIRSRVAALQRERLRLAEPGEAAPSLRAAIDAPEEWPEYTSPRGYAVGPHGILAVIRTKDGLVEKPVCDEPMMVVGRTVDAVTGAESLEVGFRRDGRWKTVLARRAQLRDARSIVPLADQGFPVHSGSARGIVEYLAACESAADLPARTTTTRIGWHGDTYVAGPGGPIELVDPDRKRAGWKPRGTWEGYKHALRHADRVPVAWAMLYQAVAAILLRWLELGFCPFGDLSGPSGKGKTSSAKFVAAGWGYPAHVFDDENGVRCGGAIAASWDLTIVGLELTAASVWDAPLIIDDTAASAQSVEDRNKLVAHACYQLPQGIGRIRSERSADRTRGVLTWRNVALSTSEKPVVSNTEAGGARNRVLSITDTPVFPDRETAMALEEELKQHHGHLASRVAEAALRLGSKLKELHRESLAGWAERAEADTRLLSAVAAMSVAAYVVHEVLGIPRPSVDPFEEGGVIERALFHSIEEADQGDRALAVIREDLARHPDGYEGSATARAELVYDFDQKRSVPTGRTLPPPSGWRGTLRKDCIGVLPGVLSEILRAAGHDLDPVLKRWEAAGVLMRGDGRNLAKKVRIGDVLMRMYVFRRDLLEGSEAQP